MCVWQGQSGTKKGREKKMATESGAVQSLALFIGLYLNDVTYLEYKYKRHGLMQSALLQLQRQHK